MRKLLILPALTLICAVIATAVTPREAFEAITSLHDIPVVARMDSVTEEGPITMYDVAIAMGTNLPSERLDSIRDSIAAVIAAMPDSASLVSYDSPENLINISVIPDSAAMNDMLILVISRPESVCIAINASVPDNAVETITSAQLDTTGGSISLRPENDPSSSIINISNK